MTPMRKLIMKMEDMASLVFNQCITDNRKKPENDDYSVSSIPGALHKVKNLINFFLQKSLTNQ